MNMLSWIQKTVFAFSGLSRSLKLIFFIRSIDLFILLCFMCNVSQFLFLAPDAAEILRYKKDFLLEVLTFIYFKISIEKDFNETRGIRTPDNLIKSYTRLFWVFFDYFFNFNYFFQFYIRMFLLNNAF